MGEPRAPDIWKGDLQPQQGADQSVEEDTPYPQGTWEQIAGLLNIPLSKEKGNMFGQISQFLRSHTVASGQETISWSEDYQPHEYTLATAHVNFPRKAHWGIPTKGWYLFHYTLPDGSAHIGIIAERENAITSTGEETSGAEVSFTRQPDSSSFLLDKREYHVPWSEYICGIPHPLMPDAIGRRISRYRSLGSEDVAAFHVYNQHPPLPSGQKEIKR